jgi:hypothetical protein
MKYSPVIAGEVVNKFHNGANGWIYSVKIHDEDFSTTFHECELELIKYFEFDNPVQEWLCSK